MTLTGQVSDGSNGPSIIARGGVLFKETAQVAFSEFIWTLACPIWISQADGHAKVLKDTGLDMLGKRMSVIKKTNGMSRQKRGVINLGGMALKWLFGVATTSKINQIADAVQQEKGRSAEIYQMMYLHTSLINGVIWASKANSKSIIEINSRVGTLEGIVSVALNQINEREEHATTTLRTDEVLDDIRKTLT